MKPSDLAKIEWHVIHKRKRSPFFINACFEFVSKPYVNVGFDYTTPTTGSIVSNIVVKKSEMDALGARLWAFEQSEPGFLLRFMTKFESMNHAHASKWTKLQARGFNQRSNAELASSYAAYLDDLKGYGPAIYTPLAAESQLFAAGTEILKKHGLTDAEKTVFQPVHPGLALEEQASLARIAIALNAGQDVTRALEKHAEENGWMKTYGFFLEFYGADHYLNQARAMEKPDSILEQFERETSEHRRAFERVLDSVSPPERLVLETINHAIFFRSYRTERLSQSAFYFKDLFAAISSAIGLETHTDSLYLLPEDVHAALTGRAATTDSTRWPNLVNERKTAYTFVTSPDGNLVKQGNDALECLKFFESTQKKESASEVKGMVSFKGHVQGIARIVRTLSGLHKVQTGDIMVAHSTTPDYVPVLKKIKGLVTEEGGILCHAAVVSREMQIPCIIGARHATKIFQDGDTIDMNTDTGVVRKL